MDEYTALRAYSEGRLGAIELRRRLGNATYGEVMIKLANAVLPLTRAPIEGREADLARARAWLFPKDG